MRLRLALASVALLALSASAALAQDPQAPPPGGGMGGMGGMGMRQGGPGRRIQALLAGITLTAQQQAAVDSIQAAYTPRMRALFTPGGPPADSASRARMAELRSNQDKDVRAVLTPDQQKIFDKNLAEMPQFGGGRRGPGGQ